MRIISGEFKGRNINMIKSANTRPTMDKVREAIFNIINPYVIKDSFLDLFAGSGSIGFEALSRGFKMAVFNDLSIDALRVIKSNIELLRVNDRALIKKLDYKKLLNSINIKFSCIFLDPPYKLEVIDECLDLIVKNDLLVNDGIVICEHEKSYCLGERNDLELIKFVNYGIRNISIFRRNIWKLDYTQDLLIQSH